MFSLWERDDLGTRLVRLRVQRECPAASGIAVRTNLPAALILSHVSPPFTVAAICSFAQQALSTIWDQAITQILYDRTPVESVGHGDKGNRMRITASTKAMAANTRSRKVQRFIGQY
jgi:hypothetical protein